jgi:hypothetical protein
LLSEAFRARTPFLFLFPWVWLIAVQHGAAAFFLCVLSKESVVEFSSTADAPVVKEDVWRSYAAAGDFGLLAPGCGKFDHPE